MEENERLIRQKLKDDFQHYAVKCLSIRNKKGDIERFKFNRVQIYSHNLIEKQKRETGKVRVIFLKGRQQGISTYVCGRIYHQLTHLLGKRAFILTHEKQATSNLFDMTQRYHDNCPRIVRPEATSETANELYFGDLDSGYKIGTAGNKGVGRSSTIQFFHGSEVAFWPNAHLHAAGILQAIPDVSGTEAFLESTPDGIGNYYHEQWQLAESGQSDFIPIFLPWYWQEEYTRPVPPDFSVQSEEMDLVRLYDLTAPQLMWRRYKIIELSTSGGNGDKQFDSQYPINPIVAFQSSGFDTYINPTLVMYARKAICEGIGPLVIGVDPARFGDDRTAIIRRRGRVLSDLKTYLKKDTMEVAGIVWQIIKNENPTKVFIDVGGLGAGVVDRVNELMGGKNDVVVAVNAGSSPLDAEKYVNKRAEMWGLFAKWLAEQPCQIPDSDELHADLTSVKYKYDSINRLVIEPKSDMKRRGIRSSDCADAACLTFAEPIETLYKNNFNSEQIANAIMSRSNRLDRLRSTR